MTFQCKIAINFMTFQKTIQISAKMSKFHILAEIFLLIRPYQI